MAEQLLGRPLSGNNIASEIVNTEEQAPSAVLGRSITGFEEPAQQEDYSTIGDIARGAGAGALNIFQGVAELGAAGIDYVADTDTGTATTNAFESVKESLGFVPTGTAGHVAEMLVNYGSLAIPIGGWIGAAGKAGQAVKGGAAVADVVTGATKIRRGAQAFGATKTGQALTGSRVARAGSTALATGLADILVSPSTNHTLADSWDALPSYLRTEDETGLTGRDQASVRLANKFKLGLEGAGFTLIGEAVLPVIGLAVGSIAKVPGVPAIARGLSTGLDYAGSLINKSSFFKKNFTSNGLAPSEVINAMRTAEGMTEFDMQQASKVLSNYDSAMKKASSFMGLFGRNRVGTQAAYEDTMDYLAKTIDPATSAPRVTPQIFRSKYGDKALAATDEMRGTIDDLSVQFENSVRQAPNLNPTQQAQLLQQFQNSHGQYIRRLYDLHLTPEKFKGVRIDQKPQYQAALREVSSFLTNTQPQFAGNPASAMQQAKITIDEIFGNTLMAQGLTPEAAALRAAETAAIGAEQTLGRTNLFKLGSGMLTDRTQLLDNAPMLREMMGEVRNPREAFLRTVDSMSSTMASQKLFNSIANTGMDDLPVAIAKINQGKLPFVIKGSTVNDAASMDKLGYVKAGEMDPDNAFGGAFGALSGNWVPKEIYDSLTTPARVHSGMQDALAIALQAKGLTQMAKTVLNPLSQVRNFLSNTFILGANGLVGRNMGIFESADVLLSNAINSPEQFKFLRALAEEGAIGQNIQLNEMTRLLKEQTAEGYSAMLRKAGDKFRQSKAGAPVRFMEKTYQLGDDYWKVVAALGEKARYGAAFRAAGMDIEALAPGVQKYLIDSGLAGRGKSIANTGFGDLFSIDIVKATMPTYSMVPEIIKNIRRIPVVGNFMSFPAEIMRTTGNIVNRGLKELSFKAVDNGQSLIQGLTPEAAKVLQRQVRAIGAKRLSSYVAMATVAPGATVAAAHSVLGITPEQEAMIQQSAPFFSKGNSLMALQPISKDGKTQIVDLSYMMPYEFMLAPARAALQTYQEKGEMDANVANQIASSAWEGFKKFAEPFASESLGAERLIDVTIRNGKTQTGAPVYEEGAELGDKLSAALTHVSGAFIPGIAEQLVTVRGGEFTQGRVARSITGTPSKQGDLYTPAEEAGTMMTGLRPMNIDFGRSLGFAGGEYASLSRSATKIFTGKADDNDISEQGVLDAYVKANDARKAQMAGMYAKVQRARAAGMDDSSIRNALKGTGASKKEVNSIMNNQYIAIKPSRSLIREINQEVNVKKENRLLDRLPMKEINEILQSYNRAPLVNNDQEQAIDETPLLGRPLVETSTPAPAPQSSAPAPAPVAQAPAPQPQAAAPQARRSVSPILMGTNPIDMLKNMDIFQRLGGGQ